MGIKRRDFCLEMKHRRNKHRRQHFEEHYRRHHEEFHKYRKRVKYIRPAILLFNLLLWYLIFRYIGLKTISIIFAVFISLKGILEFFFLARLEKRIFKPIEQLRNGVEEIAKGNYDVEIEPEDINSVTTLIYSFNDMARKLQESEKIKSEYEENRRMLIANISHDLKTPITSIQGYIEAILEGNAVPPENLNRYLQTIYNNSVYINKLIDDLFLFSKLDMQKLNFDYEVIQVNAFMEDLMEEFKFDLEEKMIGFRFNDTTENKLYVKMDRKRINQAIRNIIGNAVKYGPENGLKIEVEMSFKEELLYIEVRDNGPGIPEDKLPHIFDRFYRVDLERTKDLMSTGLGLAISKELIEAHGGNITASNIKERGTCFTIVLPVVKSQEGCME